MARWRATRFLRTWLTGVRRDSVIARGSHDDDAGARGCLDRLNERIGCRGFVNRMPERQIDDVDVQRLFVRGNELDRRDDVARPTDAVLVEHFQCNEPGTRRNPPVWLLRRAAVAGDQAGDVRSVAVPVRRRSLLCRLR